MVENGIKFNKSKVVDIRFEHILENDKLKLIITDNGIGIDKHGQSKIFDLFTKLENRSKFPGTGFGLGMAKKILEYYNGKIFLKKSEKTGSVFQIELQSNIVAV